LTDAKLPRCFYARETLTVAKELIGLNLVHACVGHRHVARIVETEAYKGPQDLAAHSARGRTARTEVMFGPPGHAYVYLIYGIWHCLNVVTAACDVPHAVLIRAAEPVSGIDGVTHGPGLLCKAMHIDRSHNGTDLAGGTLWIEKPRLRRGAKVARSTRIGVDYAQDWARKPWRFYDPASAYVSTVSAAVRRSVMAGNAILPARPPRAAKS
jgi:DNA-3-methyladenine glycosylase